MRNFYNQPTSKIFDKMFGKGARQIQADPTLDLTKCKCCQCDKAECKGCISSHVLTNNTGCCHSKNAGVIFEYERPADFGAGMECCRNPSPCCPQDPPSECGGDWTPGGPNPICRPPEDCLDLEGNVLPPCSQSPIGYRRCCGTGKKEASNVRFFYNYVGQYFKFHYDEVTGKTDKLWPKNGRPRLCSFCDPHSVANSKGGFPTDPNVGKCLDYYEVSPGGLVVPPSDDAIIGDPNIFENNPCHYRNSGDEIAAFNGCECMGSNSSPEFLLRDQNRFNNSIYDPLRHKRMSKYRKRQMERQPNYRWLADTMCYDAGNRVLDPVHEWIPDEASETGFVETTYPGNGTLYDHLLAVVHCEHWYELARCPQNPQHGDTGGILGSWIDDPATGEPLGINTSVVAPRFWIYACSGVPIFDFDIKDALKRGFISDNDYIQITLAISQKKTPKQEYLLKMSKGGYFDIGDWRQEALNEIEVLKGLSYTKDYYSGISGSDPNFGACCMYAPPGATSGPNAFCFATDNTTCGLCGGDFFASKECSSDLCVSCSGFKPHDLSNSFAKYLGPVRKRLWVPQNLDISGDIASPGGLGIVGLSGPARLDPKKARPNTISDPPTMARGEIPAADFINQDKTIFDLQLPPDLIKEPWTIDGRNGTRVYPQEPPPNATGQEPEYEEWRQFKIWRDSQWLYMHARPGGWDYVCAGYFLPPEQGGNPAGEPYVIPDLPRQYSILPGWPGGCLAGLWGVPRESYEFEGGCPNDINCGYIDGDGNFVQFPLVGCSDEYGSCIGIECIDSGDCTYHPERGGGSTPCQGVAFASSCDGIRWVKFKHRLVNNSEEGTCYNDYLTCAGDTINSFLYTVNKETGNFADFCPHSCRSLTVPKSISNLVPTIFSNRLSHERLCRGLRSALTPDCGPYPGRQCKGLYCQVNNVVTFNDEGVPQLPNPYYYAPLGNGSNYCCSSRTPGLTAEEPSPPSDPLHNAASCRRLPGPGYPALYDGKFVGEAVNFNPMVCCFYCPPQGSGVSREYLGVKPYYECSQQLDELAKQNGHENLQSQSGVGFFYKPEDINSFSQCESLGLNCGCANLGAERQSLCPPVNPGDDGDVQ